MKKQQTILVTGGFGFIGSHFIRHVLETYPSYTVINLDVLTYAANKMNLAEETKKHGERLIFVKGDICNRRLLERTLKKYPVDAVVHFAAESHVDNSIRRSDEFVRTNVQGTHELLLACRNAGIKKFLYVSTDEVYGDIEKGTTKETTAFNPSSPYAASKAAADLMVQAFIRTHRFPGLIVRGSNNFGSHQYPEKLIPAAVTSMLEGKKVQLHGDGGQIRSWLHVTDFCNAIDMTLHKARIGSIYNVAGTLLDNLTLIQRIARELNINYRKHIRHVADRPGGDRRYAPSDAKIRRELGWSPKHSLYTALPHLISWYAENQSWWRSIKRSPHFKSYEGVWQGSSIYK